MDDGRQRKARDSIWWEIRPFVYLAGGLACAVAVGYFARYMQQAHGLTDDLSWLALGCLLFAVFISQLRSGAGSIGVITWKRSEDPVPYWIAVLVLLFLGRGAIVGALGDMLGLWRW